MGSVSVSAEELVLAKHITELEHWIKFPETKVIAKTTRYMD
jgi:hypothetical protein